MTLVLGWILKLFSSGIINRVASYLEVRAKAQAETHGMDATAATSIVVEQMRDEVATRQAQLALASRHDKLVSWIGGAFAFHITMIVLDSVFHLNWHVDALPAPMDQWEGSIVLALCVATPTVNVANRLIAKVWP